jgi:acetylornithine deacetylase/succinyl-diaminopimelate desuccinylase-like protein
MSSVSMPQHGLATLDQRPAELLQHLLRFDTTNPPGSEAECIAFAGRVLQEAGFETQILGRDANRTNLVTRLPGRGDAPPLLMYGHVDVVTTEGQRWTHPPFEGKVVDGYVWGRGALDMKGAVVMMMAALMRAKAQAFAPPGDVVLALVSDEEAGGEFGAKYLVDNHASLFEGIRYAIGEAGGFSFYVGGAKLYPIMVAEKQICWTKVTVRGRGGHGSMPVHGEAMAKLARVLQKLDQQRLPVHIPPATRQMIDGMASALASPQDEALRLLLNPEMTDAVLDQMGPIGAILDPLLHNTVSPTILHGSSKINVIPAEISVELDGRLLPGYGPDDMVAELGQLLGDEVELAVIRHDPGPPEPDMGLLDTLVDILRRADPQGTPSPLLMPGVTDARHFSRLGIQTYGFTPMNMPPEFDFWTLAHSADERIPVEALEFGIERIYELLQRFAEGN